MRSELLVAFAVLSSCTRAVPLPDEGPPAQRGAHVEAIARLPASTFTDGPPSGARFAGINGAPWPTQPVQGFSALVALPDGGFLTVSDNGYGAPETSADFLPRVYALTGDLAAGSLSATPLLTLHDPDGHIPWPLVNGFTAARNLTGADVDPESLVLAPDGTFWLGDEFGPFLLHVDERGRLLEAPIELPAFGLADGGVLRGPDSPFLRPNLMLRSLEALRARASSHHAQAPAFSPNQELLASEAQVRQLQRAGFKVLPWTVNEPARMRELLAWGVDGLISDRPDLALAAAGELDAGLEVQGHRGARGLRPENTLPAFELALDLGVQTLELDLTATKDGALIWHDAWLPPQNCREVRGTVPRTITDSTSGALAGHFVCDGTLPKFPDQKADRDTAVVSAAFAESRSLVDVYSPITPGQLFDFLREYEAFYATGKGAALPVAAARLKSVRAVHLNIETKVHDAAAFEQWRKLTDLIARLADTGSFRQRVTLQSFDWRSVALAQEKYPWLQTVVLMDAATMTGPLERRAGLPWPEAPAGPVTVQRSGGFEGLALSADGTHLLALLEKPVRGDRALDVFNFSLASRTFEGVAFRFPLATGATAVGDFTMVSATEGLALERDDGDGEKAKHKRLVHFTVGAPGAVVQRGEALDLLALTGPDGQPFSFPFVTPEGVARRADGTIAIINDNNFPFGRARSGETPDGTELLLIAPREEGSKEAAAHLHGRAHR